MKGKKVIGILAAAALMLSTVPVQAATEVPASQIDTVGQGTEDAPLGNGTIRITGAKATASKDATYAVLLPTKMSLVAAEHANSDGTVTCTGSYEIKVKGDLDPAYKIVVKASSNASDRTLTGTNGDTAVLSAVQEATDFVGQYYSTHTALKAKYCPDAVVVDTTYTDTGKTTGKIVTDIPQPNGQQTYSGTFKFSISCVTIK